MASCQTPSCTPPAWRCAQGGGIMPACPPPPGCRPRCTHMSSRPPAPAPPPTPLQLFIPLRCSHTAPQTYTPPAPCRRRCAPEAAPPASRPLLLLLLHRRRQTRGPRRGLGPRLAPPPPPPAAPGRWLAGSPRGAARAARARPAGRCRRPRPPEHVHATSHKLRAQDAGRGRKGERSAAGKRQHWPYELHVARSSHHAQSS